VVGKFVEFFGPGLAELPLADRCTIANMSPEYGATCGIFPVDAETLRYLRQTGRSDDQVRLVEAYCKEQGLFHDANTPAADYTDSLELDLATVEPSMAGPSRPQDRVALKDVKTAFHDVLPKLKSGARKVAGGALPVVAVGPNPAAVAFEEKPHVAEPDLDAGILTDGSVVIAAITSCTNTSNPSVMIGAGILAKKAVEKGLNTKPWVKTSLAPGSKVVTDYYTDSGLLPYLEKLKFNVVGYGCTTCIGNSGPLPDSIAKEIHSEGLVVSAVLSGNRNFEGRVHPDVRANYLASPPLVVAYALAGKIDIDWETEPLGPGTNGKDVFLRDIWPTQQEVQAVIDKSIRQDAYQRIYASVFDGDANWKALRVPTGDLYQWDSSSTYIANPPYFVGITPEPGEVREITGARCLALLGDSITTDHISPAGSIKKDSPAGRYLMTRGVGPKDFNQYGARRGHHEVMMRGTFANVRLKNQLVPGVEGGVTRHLPDGEEHSIYDAAMRYLMEGTPLVILAGKEYGSGSSRDWAAKGTRLLGVRAVIAESFERIHRSNLVGMGVLPLQFKTGENPQSLGLTGEEVFDIEGLLAGVKGNFAGALRELSVKATRPDGAVTRFQAVSRIDTPQEVLYYVHGGILPYVLRQLIAAK
jgi:aconitate hydratase